MRILSNSNNAFRLLLCILSALSIVFFPQSSASAADNPDDYILLLKRGAGWELRKQIDGTVKLGAPENVGQPNYCIDVKSDGGITSNDVVMGAFYKILQAYINNSVGNTIEEERRLLRYNCMYNDFLLVRRASFSETQRNADGRSFDISKYEIVGVIDFASLKREILSGKAEQVKAQQESRNYGQQLVSLANADSKENIYVLTLATSYNGGISFQDGACTLTSYVNGTDGYGAYIRSLYKLYSFDEKTKRRGRGFALTYESLADLYNNYDKGHQIFSKNNSGACAAYVDFAKNILLLKNALERDYPSQQFNITFYEARQTIASANGFENFAVFDLANKMGVDAEGLKQLAGLGVTSLGDFKAQVAEMNGTMYATGGRASDLINYINDRNEGARSGKSAVQVRADRDRRLAAQEAAERAKQVAAASRHNAEFPYYAVFTCGIGNGHMAITACFSDTEMEIRSGSDYGTYNIVRIVNGGVPNGRETGSGYIVDLRPSFSIKAQNSNETNILLGLKVYKRGIPSPIFTKEVGGYGVIRVSN